MKDIPIFTTQYGTASLVLREIPYQQTAYVRILAADHIQGLLEECIGFCRAVGAEKIYGADHGELKQYPLYTAIVRMRCGKEQLETTDAALFPVQEHTLERWLEIYRQKVRRVPNGAWMTDADGKQMLADGSGYYIHRGESLLGIGKLRENTIEFLASVQPGVGEDIVRALAHAVFSDDICLEVATSNTKAVMLYDRLGFLPIKELARWYKIF